MVGRHTIQMKYKIETKDGKRTCGNCGKLFPLEEFKTKKPGYDWRCKECREYLEAYNE
ncbi:hypothetical protein K9M79_02905 [Candidatus Woesearchaeota archaeon]|nr:hypothetical protein [Candidatus Woesearchaeota archaeon]